MDNINNFDDLYSTISKCTKIIDLQEQLIKNQDVMISNLNARVDIFEKIIEKKDIIIETKDTMIELLEKQSKWISVKEKLPEDGTWNIFTDGMSISVERYKSDALDHFYPNGRWFNFDKAVAWIPLPEL